MSERWLAHTGSPLRDGRDSRVGRLVDGYDGLIDALVRPVRTRVRLNSAVFAVTWKRGRVEVEDRSGRDGRRGRLTALAIVITVPLGVLQTAPDSPGSIRFDPLVPALDRMTFLQSRSPLPFRVLWVLYPVRAPLLVAWVGGPKAAALTGLYFAELERRAVQSLAGVLSTTGARIRKYLVSSHCHDWSSDPYSRGAGDSAEQMTRALPGESVRCR